MKATRPLCAAAVLLALSFAPARAEPISQIVSFGDSLSDVGNSYAQFGYPASPPYAAGRYSNGPIWLDRLAMRLGVAAPTASQNGGLNYAVGGAATDTPAISPVPGYAPLITPALQVIGLVPNVNTQIASYLATHSPTSGTLYTLWAGANDFFDGQTNPLIPADNLQADILNLINKGAKNFLVANLPSLDLTPLGRGEGPAAQAGLKALTAGFNAELGADLDQVQAAHPDVQLHRLDAFGLFQAVEANPAAFGLTNATDPAILAPDGANLDGYLFWDDVHPTAPAGRIIGDAAFKAAAPEPSSVVLLLTGCLGAGSLLRRNLGIRLLRSRGALLLGALLCVVVPCWVRASPASPPQADSAPSVGSDAASPAPSLEAPTATPDDAPAPVEPLVQHLKLDTTWLPGRNANGLEIIDVDGTITLAAPLGQGIAPLLFTPGAGLHFWNVPRTGTAVAPPPLPTRLFDSYVEVGWQPRLAEWLFADLAVTPGVYSDFRDVSSQSFQMRGRGVAIVAFSPQFQIALGALYVNYNRTKVLPAGGVLWNPDGDTRLQLLFPQPKLAHRIGAWRDAEFWGYLKGEFGGGRWSVERSDGSAEFIDYTDVRAILGLERVTPGGLTSHVEVGYVFNRRVTFTSSTTDYSPDATVLRAQGFAISSTALRWTI